MDKKEFTVEITNDGKNDSVSYTHKGISPLEVIGLIQVIQTRLLDNVNFEYK